jgi:hypothetical protein
MAQATPRLRPLGVGDLLDEMIRLYRNHFLLLAGISVVVLGPLGLLQFIWQAFVTRPGLTRTGAFNTTGATGVWTILSILGAVAVSLAITIAVSEVYLGRNPTIGSAYLGGLRRFAWAVGLTIVITLTAAAMAVTIIGFPFALYFGVCWTLSFQIVVLEGRGIRASMGRSRALVRGTWWRVLGIMALIGIISTILGTVIGLAAGSLQLLLLMGHSSGLAYALLTLVTAIVSIAANVLTTPIWCCGAVLLYYDLRVRKEGFDLELMAQNMGDSTQTGPVLE